MEASPAIWGTEGAYVPVVVTVGETRREMSVFCEPPEVRLSMGLQWKGRQGTGHVEAKLPSGEVLAEQDYYIEAPVTKRGPWTLEEDEELLSGLHSGILTKKEIAKRLGRTYKALQQRLRQLQKEQR